MWSDITYIFLLIYVLEKLQIVNNMFLLQRKKNLNTVWLTNSFKMSDSHFKKIPNR